MSKSGFVQAVKSKGKYYFYVRVSYRDKDKNPRSKNIMGLGQKEKALSLLNSWILGKDVLPDELNKYSIEDLKEWIKYVENK